MNIAYIQFMLRRIFTPTLKMTKKPVSLESLLSTSKNKAENTLENKKFFSTNLFHIYS